jgi:succinyl-CoA synthetase alpha subunit
MQVAKGISNEPDIEQAVVLMGTENNKKVLIKMGVKEKEIDSVSSNDVVIFIEGSKSQVDLVRNNIDRWFTRKTTSLKTRVYTLDKALKTQPEANLAVISVPGRYAAREARKALDKGLNIFLFSDNVSVEEELSLKQYADQQGLLVMGPDCGTAIIAGVSIGFANSIRRGKIGVVGVTGTGLQEFTCLIHQAGLGISHAIGTGSRDLSDEIGGLSAFKALELLEGDPETKLIVLISKPPGLKTLDSLVKRLNSCPKPIVTCILGTRQFGKKLKLKQSIVTTDTIAEAAIKAAAIVEGKSIKSPGISVTNFSNRIKKEIKFLATNQRYLRGIFAGGTFCYQAQQLMAAGGLQIHSNAPLAGMIKLTDPTTSIANSMVDMGEDYFTKSSPHPMIDPRLSKQRIIKEAHDPEVAVILLDFILGFMSSENPAGELAPAIIEARKIRKNDGGHLIFIASVCGTDLDIQNLKEQLNTLEEIGVIVMPSSAHAALLALEVVKDR